MAGALIVGAPHFAGLLRLAVPAAMARLRNRKAFCVSTYFASTLVLAIVPLAAVPGETLTRVQDNTSPYLADYFALNDFVFATTAVAIGLGVDWLTLAGYDAIKVYAGVMLVGFLGRMLGVPLLMAIDEPGARKLRDLLTPEAAPLNSMERKAR